MLSFLIGLPILLIGAAIALIIFGTILAFFIEIMGFIFISMWAIVLISTSIEIGNWILK